MHAECAPYKITSVPNWRLFLDQFTPEICSPIVLNAFGKGYDASKVGSIVQFCRQTVANKDSELWCELTGLCAFVLKYPPTYLPTLVVMCGGAHNNRSKKKYLKVDLATAYRPNAL